MEVANLFEPINDRRAAELSTILAAGGEFRLKRIVSTGQSTPPGEWYDEPTAEWVVLLTGSARLRFEGEADDVALQPGDYVHIPPHRRHRVEWTPPDEETVWLAVYYHPAKDSTWQLGSWD